MILFQPAKTLILSLSLNNNNNTVFITTWQTASHVQQADTQDSVLLLLLLLLHRYSQLSARRPNSTEQLARRPMPTQQPYGKILWHWSAGLQLTHAPKARPINALGLHLASIHQRSLLVHGTVAYIWLQLATHLSTSKGWKAELAWLADL